MQLNLSLRTYSGSYYNIGHALAKKAKEQYGANYIDTQLDSMKDSFLYSALGMNYHLDDVFINEASSYLKEVLSLHHPGLLIEIEGFADGLGQPIDKVLAFVLNFGNGKGCTHLYANGLHGHNYDDHPNNVDMQFLDIKPQGCLRSGGFSAAQIGRFDGINEKGLSVSLSWGAGEIGSELKLSAELFIRIILDKTSSVEEAVALFEEIRYGSANNLLISDSQNNAVVIENSGRKYKIRNINSDSFLYCANSYVSKGMKVEQKYTNPTTKWRESFIDSHISSSITVDKLKEVLTTNYPEGLFEPYYKEELGTLWTIIFEPQARKATIIVGESKKREEKVVDLQQAQNREDVILSVMVPESHTNER
jgi:predicted choloylglycine hydrolase